MANVFQLHESISDARLAQLFHWVDQQQNFSQVKLLAKIKKVHAWNDGPSIETQGAIYINGYEIHTTIIANVYNGNALFETGDCGWDTGEFYALKKLLKPKSIWLVMGELFMVPDTLPCVVHPKFLPIPEHLRGIAHKLLNEPLNNIPPLSNDY